jgi:hypothetical protein
MTAPDHTRRAAEEIQAATTQGWADDLAQNRCPATRAVTTPRGEEPVRCDGTAGHGGDVHTGHIDHHRVVWSV